MYIYTISYLKCHVFIKGCELSMDSYRAVEGLMLFTHSHGEEVCQL